MEETGTPREETRFWFLSPEAYVFRLAIVRCLEAEERRFPSPNTSHWLDVIRDVTRKLTAWYVAAVMVCGVSAGSLLATVLPDGLLKHVRWLFAMRLAQAIGFCFIIALTYAAFWLRKHYRMTYALAELVIGVASSAVAVAQLKDVAEPADFFALATAVFLLIRGMDNIEEGIKLAAVRANDSPFIKKIRWHNDSRAEDQPLPSDAR